MFQGVASNVGKSILAAGFCRIFKQDGLLTAPFKAWNMALNSFVTLDGQEMSRAQATQAKACNIEPTALMNPVLLKPDSVNGSQLILCGQPQGYITATSYPIRREMMTTAIREAYRQLAARYEVIVIEGAGSPAEINLKHNDMANMFMAELANAPVLIIGDIDRGGVYAHLAGTFDLLEPHEQQRVNGFIINKFHGDPAQLTPANDFLEKHTGKKVLGVIPHIHNLRLPHEDSTAFKEHSQNLKNAFTPETINIALIDPPHISNFTDFDPFTTEPDVRLIATRKPEDLLQADIILLPGSKNTVHDLHWMWEQGFPSVLARCNAKGKTLIGICAGYQMLGKRIRDPQGVESSAQETDGLQLLDLETVMDSQKRLTNVSAICLENGALLSGFEIHHGRSECYDIPFIEGPGGEVLGCRNRRGNVWGSYLHGIFESSELRSFVLDDIRIRKGLPAPSPLAFPTLDQELDRLADVIRANINMEEIHRIMKNQRNSPSSRH